MTAKLGKKIWEGVEGWGEVDEAKKAWWRKRRVGWAKNGSEGASE